MNNDNSWINSLRERMIPPFGNEIEQKEVLKFKCSKTPTSLYKYFSCDDYNLSSLKKNSIFLNRPKNFNDPYDTTVCNYITDEWRESFRKTKNLKEYPEFMKPFEESLTDKHQKDLSNRMRENSFLVSCFSRNLHNMPMWAHYADNHKGFVLEYDFSSLTLSLDKLTQESYLIESLYPVFYQQERLNINIYQQPEIHDQKSDKISNPFSDLLALLHKSPLWSYEQEWRLSFYEKDAPTRLSNRLTPKNKGYLLTLPFQPTVIYLGSFISGCNEEKIRNYANSNQIMVKKMILTNSKEYELSFED